jgi:hypothetical protein
VISLQKVDSLLVLEGNGELIRFLVINAGGICIKIHLNLHSGKAADYAHHWFYDSVSKRSSNREQGKLKLELCVMD